MTPEGIFPFPALLPHAPSPLFFQTARKKEKFPLPPRRVRKKTHFPASKDNIQQRMAIRKKIFRKNAATFPAQCNMKMTSRGVPMKQNMQQYFRAIQASPFRSAIPILTAPGIELARLKASDVFRSGALQFECIKALAETVRADAPVTFMDLSVEAEAFGAPVRCSEYENPTVSGSIASTAEEIDALPVPVPGDKRTAENLRCAALCAEYFTDRPVFGGMIGPFSLAGRLADMTEIMILAATEPETAHALLKKNTSFLTAYAEAIKRTGVNGLLIAEPAAGLLSPEMCREFAADYLRQIIAAVQDENFAVILHNCGNAADRQLESLLSSGAAALHLGNAVDLPALLPQIPREVLLMGNLDPVGVLKNGSPEKVYEETLRLLQATEPWRNYVLSTGCDVPPGVSIENIRAFFRAKDDYNRTRA